MSIKKILLLAGMALAATTFAVPATASAFTIKDGGKTLEDVKIPLTGKLKVQALGSGIECTLDATITVNVDTVDVTEVNLTTSSCSTFGTPYKNCEIESDAATLPWSVTVNETSLEIPSGAVDVTLKAKSGKTCFTKKNNITFKGIFIHWTNWSGETIPPYCSLEWGFNPVTVDTDGGASQAAAEGTLENSWTVAETYEIA